MAAEARGTLGVHLDSPVARRVLTRVQQELPVRERPYAALGDACGTSEEQAFAAVEAARTADIVRRIGASFESSRIGYHPRSSRLPWNPATSTGWPRSWARIRASRTTTSATTATTCGSRSSRGARRRATRSLRASWRRRDATTCWRCRPSACSR